MSDITVPKNTKYIDAKKGEAQSNVENAFNDFKKLLNDKTHADLYLLIFLFGFLLL